MAEVNWGVLTEKIGLKETYQHQINETDVWVFESLRQSFSRLHLDAEFAGTTRFAKPIVSGQLVVAMAGQPLTKLLEEDLKLKSALVSSSFQFLKPTFVGDVLTSEVELVSVKPEEKRVRFSVKISNNRSELVSKGEFVERPVQAVE